MSMNNSNQPNLCKQGCGYYGNAQNMDMCSKCYQKFLKSSNQEETHQQFSTNISEIYLQRSPSPIDSEMILVSAVKDGRKRATYSDSEIACKVPKTSYDENDIHDALSKQVCVTVAPGITDNLATKSRPKISEDNESAERSPVNSQHSTSPIAKKPRRCLFCHRKVGLTGFDCRCGGHFCAVHRYSDKHACSFDYQAQGQEQIKNQNPMICGSKIKKI